ncbi:lysylphosphatidylglycerol synthase domain-containing protein [uncultured Microbacterium sp.]|uniref:lysylphosphatidylglycerol synthase domain-containing protein n=1 Tax=uncultured Microbacterium sp. TaxID=191216 RepID=UPI0028D5A2F1|nr:lysylphosphatidylglycerol synthase domain-containing protein [uncultured Microbacterium sp.]
MLTLRYVLLAVVLGFAAYYLISQWNEVSQAIKLIAPASIIVSFFFVALGLGFGTVSWIAILNGLGHRIPILRSAQILLVGQLGKYVPGSVWSYVMQMELGRQYGVARPRILITALYAAGVGVVASLILGSLALPVLIDDYPQLLWLFALLPVGLICLHPKVMTWLASLTLKLFRRPPLDHEVSFSVVLRSLGAALASYICYGIHLFVLVNSLVDPDIGTLILLTGAMSIGFTVGLVAFLLPSGLGAREAVLIGAMGMLLTIPQAAAMSVVSRMMFTLADILAAGAAVLAVIIMRKRLASEGSVNVEALPEDSELPANVANDYQRTDGE